MNKEAQNKLNKIINAEIEGFGVNGELGIEDLVDYALKSFDFNDNNAAYIALQRIKDKLALQREKKAMIKQTQEALNMAAYDLDGVITDVEKFDGFDDVCLQTIKRVRSTIAKALEQPAQSDVDLELKQFSKNLIDNQIQDEHPLSSEQLWGLYETEQPAQEPVAWRSEGGVLTESRLQAESWVSHEGKATPLYTHPHQWQGLTDDEIDKCGKGLSENWVIDFARAIEQALKEKNHGA